MSPALAEPPRGPITATDYHTAGEPFRIVTGGVPPLDGAHVLNVLRRERRDRDE